MSDSEQLVQIPNDEIPNETADPASIHYTHEPATIADDDVTIHSDSNPNVFTISSPYQPIYLSSVITTAELDKTLPYLTAVTELYGNDAQGTKYHEDDKQTHDGRINRFDNSISKYHRRHRQRTSPWDSGVNETYSAFRNSYSASSAGGNLSLASCNSLHAANPVVYCRLFRITPR
ncbi:unnamed protein product [Cercopithifilaria johnstoni]|uniref:Uncharacterized protein n=1 Tax=Cercopithifilaria johnstoni TaxID=2874296 RepID=A0A8J2QA49_9BILA|nr:unnamed protein product [Cercopithifilaria johnstoni]